MFKYPAEPQVNKKVSSHQANMYFGFKKYIGQKLKTTVRTSSVLQALLILTLNFVQ